jgi:L-alanine-DL-glutamate epimerase-like enolase superfamily enzyme
VCDLKMVQRESRWDIGLFHETATLCLTNILIPFFTGKDARKLDELIFWISETRVKNQGVPFCVQLATLEFAILDLLGSIADLPIRKIIGGCNQPRNINIFRSSFV